VKRLTVVIATVVLSTLVLSACSTGSRPHATKATTTTTTRHHTSTTKPVTTTAPGPRPASLVDDLTFISPTQGWALADQSSCGQPTCTQVLTTTDGGATWTKVGTIPSPSNCTTCGLVGVSHIRFANALDGYAFGPGFFTSSDGGATWTQPAGPNVVALEPVGSNVMRISFTQTGCPGPCDLTVQSAAAGSTAWQTVRGPFQADSVQLVRQATDAYVAVYGNPAGGGVGSTTMMISQDDGATWGERADPCDEVGGDEFDTVAISAAPQSVLVALCRDRAQPQRSYVAVSTDSGMVFTAQSMLPNSRPAGPFGAVAATSATSLFVGTAGASGTGRAQWTLLASSDGGQTWRQAVVQRGTLQPNFPAETFLGFENGSVGRWVGYPSNIWETTDGGGQWVKQSIATSS
jgi:photosystem II stability/assembly factor-like uncharacterized protein